MSEVSTEEPCSISFETQKLAGIPYGNRNLLPDQRRQLDAVVSGLGGRVVKLTVDSYFYVAHPDQTSDDWSHIETASQNFIGKVDSVAHQLPVNYQLDEDGDLYSSKVSGLAVSGIDRHGNGWQMFVALEDLKAVYPSSSD